MDEVNVLFTCVPKSVENLRKLLKSKIIDHEALTKLMKSC